MIKIYQEYKKTKNCFSECQCVGTEFLLKFYLEKLFGKKHFIFNLSFGGVKGPFSSFPSMMVKIINKLFHNAKEFLVLVKENNKPGYHEKVRGISMTFELDL